jgi:hypothetical protein
MANSIMPLNFRGNKTLLGEVARGETKTLSFDDVYPLYGLYIFDANQNNWLHSLIVPSDAINEGLYCSAANGTARVYFLGYNKHLVADNFPNDVWRGRLYGIN